LVCQKAPDVDDFYYLKVPAEFFRKKLPSLDVLDKGKVSLFLSAEPDDLFVDRRGRGRVSFEDFLVS
ncbi:MAG: hypothetical protein ACRDRT_02425, partial [Pseudonocardiaceae bacterium]